MIKKGSISNPAEYIPDPEEPWKDDILKREDIGRMLTTFVENLDRSFVMSITAEFGTGKSVFIRRWVAHLRKEGFACIEFNAWTNDFSKEPLISFIGEINEYIKNNKKLFGEKDSDAKELLTNLTEISKKLALSAVPLAVKLVSGNFINADGINDFIKSEVEKRIDNYTKEKETVSEFRKTLEKLSDKVKSTAGSQKPIVFVIDELDRCRPTYAIELLEVIKHFFNVPGFVFVLAIDKNQILNSIRTQYGQGMDADGYLRRFVDLEYVMQLPKILEFISYYIEHHTSLQNSLFDEKYTISSFCAFFGLSLRTIQRILLKLNIVASDGGNGVYNLSNDDRILFFFMLCLKEYSDDLFQKVLNDLIHADLFLDELLKIADSNSDYYRAKEYQIAIGSIFLKGSKAYSYQQYIDPYISRRDVLGATAAGYRNSNERLEYAKLSITVESITKKILVSHDKIVDAFNIIGTAIESVKNFK